MNADRDVWVANLAPDGSVIWQNSYGGDDDDVGYEILEVRDDLGKTKGFIVVGFTASFGAGGKDAWVFKIGETGSIQWGKTYGGNGDDEAHSIDAGQSNGYIVAGHTASFGTGNRDIWVFQTNQG